MSDTETFADNSEMMTSFTNPNYTFSDNDVINSNLPLTSDFCDNDFIEDQDINDVTTTSQTNSTGKSRKKYADLDPTSLGLVNTPDGSLMVHNDLCSPDSITSVTSEVNPSEDGSAVSSPMEKTADILEVEHTEPNTDDETSDVFAETKPKGFLGFYASLEMSAKARQEKMEKEEEEGEEEGEEEENRDGSGGRVAKTEKSKDTDKKAKGGSGLSSTDAIKRYDDKATDINSPDSNDSGIQADVQHLRSHHNAEAHPDAGRAEQGARARDGASDHLHADKNSRQTGDNVDGDKDEDEKEPPLPPGWEKHEDEDGAYYWHIKSGTIQRDPPPPDPKYYREAARAAGATSSAPVSDSEGETKEESSEKSPLLPENTHQDLEMKSPTLTKPVQPSLTNQVPEAKPPQTHEDQGPPMRRSSSEEKSDSEEKRIRFAVRSLGWVRIAEEDLTPERSSKAVNKCIVNLSLGRNDINDVVGRWGDGKDLFMDLDSEHLTLIDPQDMSILNIQPIQSIRVWGVGRDNGRDFAYVARDRTTRKHMCHVFRCDTPARQIANTLRDICKRIMVERSLQHSNVAGAQSGLQKMSISRPTNLPDLNKDHNGQKLTFQNLYKNTSFPTPMEEPKKVLRCHYLGAMQVTRAAGIEVINTAMEKAYSCVPPEKWVFVSVGVAPSTITITEHGTENVLAECRVRFLSFMGIAMRNVKMCAFIMHTAQDTYVCHIFHSEPSAGALCKTIEAACKLRYQKCLDAHPQTPGDGKKNQQTQQKQTITDTLKIGSATLRSSVQSGTATFKAGVHNVLGYLKKKQDKK